MNELTHCKSMQEINNCMMDNSMLEDIAESSPNCGSHNLGHFDIISFKEDRRVETVSMDCDLILNNQTEKDKERETRHISKSNWNEKDCCEVGYNERAGYDEMLCSTEKDTDFDMVIKECDNSVTGKDVNCDNNKILQEDSGSSDKEYEIPQSHKDQRNSADIETDEGFGLQITLTDENKKTINNEDIDDPRDNRDSDKLSNVPCDEDYHAGIKLQQELSNSNNVNKDQDLENDLFEISSTKSNEELTSELDVKLHFQKGDRDTKLTSQQKSDLNSPATKNTRKLKYETEILSVVADKEVDSLNFEDNEYFINEPEKEDTVFLEMSQEQQRRSKTYESNFVRIVDNKMSSHPAQFWSDDSLDDLLVDTTSDWDIDLLNTISEDNQNKQVTNVNKSNVGSNIFLSKPFDASSIPLDCCDSVDGLFYDSSGGLKKIKSQGSPSSCLQSISSEEFSPFTSATSDTNASISSRLILPSCKDKDNVVFDSSSFILDSDSNNSRASFMDSKTDIGPDASVSDCVQVSHEHTYKTESFDSSRQLELRHSRAVLDSAIAHYNSSSKGVEENASSKLSLLPFHRRSSASDSQHVSDHSNVGLDMIYMTQPPSADQKNEQTANKLQLTQSVPPGSCTYPCVDDVNDKSESGLNSVLNIQRSSCTVNIKEYDDATKPEGNAAPAQMTNIAAHTLDCDEKQQDKIFYINASKVAQDCSSIPYVGPAAYSSEKVESAATSVLKSIDPAIQSSSVALSGSLPNDQVPTTSLYHSLDSPKTATEKRHIKSVLNTYVNHKLNSQDYSNEDVNKIADELALVLKGSRKRSYDKNQPTSAPVTKKPYLVGSVVSTVSRDPMKESEMDLDNANGSFVRSSSQSRKSVQKYGAGIKLCRFCDTSSPGSKSIECRHSHVICHSCLEDEIRLVMASERMYLSCPEESCKAAITLESLSSVLPSLIVDLLSDNLRLKEQKASAKAIKKMQGLVICPRCSCPGLLEEQLLHFVCTTCNSSCCRYCKALWTRHEEHEGCFLLSVVGTECFKGISKLPQNWNLNITAFNKNFVQVNVPITSPEGSAVAAFFARTSSGRTQIVQIFRIQNLKLWEKYILKRKHVIEDIGASELKEKFLFHGTKAENIVNICTEGFDMRVPTANGALLGKGIYFSVTAKYSEKYADPSGNMFLARVICGWSQHGQRQLTRPQYHSTSRRMYDSCVDNVSSPTMYTVFDNSQCYPEYLIRFVR